MRIANRLIPVLAVSVASGLFSPTAADAEVRRLPGTTTPQPHQKYIHAVSEAESPVQQVYVKSKDGLYIAAAIRKPKGDGRFPAMIIYHGAPGGRGMEQLVGWSRGDHGGPVWERFLQEGFVVIVADYRGGSMQLMSTPSATGLITSTDDGLAMIDYVKALPYVDPERINLYGVSLGGNLVMNLVSRVPVRSAILGAPATIWFLGMTIPQGRTGADRFKDVTPDPEISRKNVEPIKTPILIQVGTADSLLPVATFLHDALAAQNKSVRMDIYENGYHDFVLGPQGQKRPDLPQGEALFDSALHALEESVKFVKSATQSTRSPAAAPYAARSKDGVVQLEDTKHQIVVSIVPSVGNAAYEMTVKGTNILRFPYPSLEAFKTKPARHAGNPFLAPWANRLDELAFYANGKKYPFNMELGNVRGPRPIHGLVTYASQWKVIEARADTDSASVTSRLDFWREPAWMAQFPFAHTIEMTYRLKDGVLEVATAIENLSGEAMPISVGYHPYFQLTDAPRDAWTVSVGARREWLLGPDKLPTGETRPIERFFPDPAQVRLGDFDLDHVFDDLVRDASGRAVMSVRGTSQRIDVTFGQNFRAAVIYAPASVKEFICFEPMAAISNAMNLAHRGVYKDLQTLAPGQTWRESFWVRPSGF